MRVCSILLLIYFCFTTNIFSQLNFTTHIITTDADAARSVYAIDIDEDGDLDVLSASQFDDKIAWYENDGKKNFTSHIITTNADESHSVYAEDMDGDGDTDVLSSGYNIAWYENDGNENFISHTIITSSNIFLSVYAEDVDGDEDMDVLSPSEDDYKINWYENDGNGNFTSHSITTNLPYSRSVCAIDIDEDGDMDVLSASNRGTLAYEITWYENDGNENFTSHSIITSENDIYSIYTEDIDGDGDMDVLSGGDNVVWYENDGNENFTVHSVTTLASSSWAVYAEDIDGDGNMDVLSVYTFIDQIIWYENDGKENFTPHLITWTADGVRSVYAEDIDGDGDMDVLSASSSDDTIAWYENVGTVGIANNDPAVSLGIPHLYNNYPNPFNPQTTISFYLPKTANVRINIYNLSGKLIKILNSSMLKAGYHSIKWEASKHSNGVYFIEMQVDNFRQIKKCMLLK